MILKGDGILGAPFSCFKKRLKFSGLVTCDGAKANELETMKTSQEFSRKSIRPKRAKIE